MTTAIQTTSSSRLSVLEGGMHTTATARQKSDSDTISGLGANGVDKKTLEERARKLLAQYAAAAAQSVVLGAHQAANPVLGDAPAIATVGASDPASIAAFQPVLLANATSPVNTLARAFAATTPTAATAAARKTAKEFSWDSNVDPAMAMLLEVINDTSLAAFSAHLLDEMNKLSKSALTAGQRMMTTASLQIETSYAAGMNAAIQTGRMAIATGAGAATSLLGAGMTIHGGIKAAAADPQKAQGAGTGKMLSDISAASKKGPELANHAVVASNAEAMGVNVQAIHKGIIEDRAKPATMGLNKDPLKAHAVLAKDLTHADGKLSSGNLLPSRQDPEKSFFDLSNWKRQRAGMTQLEDSSKNLGIVHKATPATPTTAENINNFGKHKEELGVLNTKSLAQAAGGTEDVVKIHTDKMAQLQPAPEAAPAPQPDVQPDIQPAPQPTAAEAAKAAHLAKLQNAHLRDENTQLEVENKPAAIAAKLNSVYNKSGIHDEMVDDKTKITHWTVAQADRDQDGKLTGDVTLQHFRKEFTMQPNGKWAPSGQLQEMTNDTITIHVDKANAAVLEKKSALDLHQNSDVVRSLVTNNADIDGKEGAAVTNARTAVTGIVNSEAFKKVQVTAMQHEFAQETSQEFAPISEVLKNKAQNEQDNYNNTSRSASSFSQFGGALTQSIGQSMEAQAQQQNAAAARANGITQQLTTAAGTVADEGRQTSQTAQEALKSSSQNNASRRQSAAQALASATPR